MLKITKGEEFEEGIQPLEYIKKRNIIGRIILPITRHLRAVNAERFMTRKKRHLDLGCGDGYFLKRSQCEERFGFDRLFGDEIKDTLDFPDAYFDYVTMLAVIEHLSEPREILKEIARILKPEGHLIITTPKKSARWIIKFYAREIDKEHKSYFDLGRIQQLTKENFKLIGYHTFALGFNQVFCLRKIDRK